MWAPLFGGVLLTLMGVVSVTVGILGAVRVIRLRVRYADGHSRPMNSVETWLWLIAWTTLGILLVGGSLQYYNANYVLDMMTKWHMGNGISVLTLASLLCALATAFGLMRLKAASNRRRERVGEP